MALLSQALHLGYLLSPHSAFQGHAAHTARWPAMLSPNGSSATCIADGVFHIPMPCFHGALPVYPKVLLHFSIMLHGAAQARGTRPLLRLLWSGEVVQHDGPRYQLRDARLSPTPVQMPLEMWLGGWLDSRPAHAG